MRKGLSSYFYEISEEIINPGHTAIRVSLQKPTVVFKNKHIYSQISTQTQIDVRAGIRTCIQGLYKYIDLACMHTYIPKGVVAGTQKRHVVAAMTILNPI